MEFLSILLLAASGCGSVKRALQEEVATATRPLEVSVEDDQSVQDLTASVAESALPESTDFSLPLDAGLET